MDLAGSYVPEGQPRVIGEQAIVVPGRDALFVRQLNGDALKGEEQPVLDAAKFMADQTTISGPS